LDVTIGHMHGSPYVMVRENLMSSFGIPCNPPPWGNLTAIDVNSGKIRWQIPFGRKPVGPFNSPAAWGAPNQGGPIVTGGGLIFIGATLDGIFHAYDLQSGEEVWRAELPAPGIATPMTYEYGPGRRQYVVIAAGGHARLGKNLSDAIVAFALPD